MDHQQGNHSDYVVPTEAHVVLSGDQAQVMSEIAPSPAIGRLIVHMDDEIIRDTLVCHKGHVTNDRVRELLGLSDPPPTPEETEPAAVESTDNDESAEETPPAEQEEGSK